LHYVYSNRLNWGRFRREENILWSFAPHDVALLLRLAGEIPAQVWAHGSCALHPTIADVTVTHLQFSSGLRAHIHVSWLHPFKEQRLVVAGDRGLAVFEDTAPPGEKLLVFDHGIDWVDRAPVAKTASRRSIPFGPEEPLEQECSAFLRACATRIPPVTDAASGVAVLDVLAACERSMAAHGAPMTVGAAANGEPHVGVHPSAFVDPGASIGGGARVWHFSHIMPGAVIGERVVVGQNAFIADGVRVGAGSKLQNNVSLYSGVEIEEDVFVGPSAVFTNVRHPRAHVERKSDFERTLVRRGATIGANATVRCGVVIGEYAVVGAGALVTHDVPPHAVVLGAPARWTGWACACGESLSSADERDWVCSRCGSVFQSDDSGGLRRPAK
jgi:UDP-2-acetamido-3-amino-2,3-dideoxy-glucuronate N-acetyltransferase